MPSGLELFVVVVPAVAVVVVAAAAAAAVAAVAFVTTGTLERRIPYHYVQQADHHNVVVALSGEGERA